MNWTCFSASAAPTRLAVAGSYGAMVYEHLSRTRPVDSACFSQEDLFYVFRHRNAGEHEVGLLSCFPGAFHQRAAGRDECLRLAARAVVDIDIMVGLAQIDRHVRSHRAETDKGYPHFN